jgi:hypothetical protein
MYPQTLYPKTKQVLDKLKKLSILKDFYLAGGTALALQIGHRRSVDLDFFTKKFPKRDLLLQELRPLNPSVSQEAPGTMDLLINNVKVSFLEYKYPLLQPLVNYREINLANTIDIACMKLSAVSSRGSKKDFVDLYVILQKYELNKLINDFEEKYKGADYQKVHILKSLIFFDDADEEPELDYIKNIKWEAVKTSIENKVKNYLANLEKA